MVIERAPLEDELGDVLEKALRHAGLAVAELAERAGVDAGRIRDAIDYRHDFSPQELGRLAAALRLNEVGLNAVASGRYPLPELGGLPFCLYPLRMAHGIGVVNAYVVAECGQPRGVLFDTGADYAALRRVWPHPIHQLEAIFITHQETEHIGTVDALQAAYGPIPVYAPRGADVPGAQALGEGDCVRVAGLDVTTWATPGHAERHHCYRVARAGAEAAPLLIAGDLLFAGSVGCAYFCCASLQRQLRRLFTDLPDATVVAPGHGPLTTIRNERTFNPFIL